jgi:hypothetical protein
MPEDELRVFLTELDTAKRALQETTAQVGRAIKISSMDRQSGAAELEGANKREAEARTRYLTAVHKYNEHLQRPSIPLANQLTISGSIRPLIVMDHPYSRRPRTN